MSEYPSAIGGPAESAGNYNDSPKAAAEKRRQDNILSGFKKIGASVHSPGRCPDRKAGRMHIYDSGPRVCHRLQKKIYPQRGIDFLSNICKTVSVPVFGIGGIHPDNMHLAMECGASGACMM